MFYIHKTSCISPQQTFQDIDLDKLHGPTEKKMHAIEPSYNGIPPGILRRMGKAVRMGVGAAMPLLQDEQKPAGLIIGTANGGKEDCVKFLNQIIEYDEGMLTPMNFVQSTPNAVAAQIGLLTNNHGYNITHLQLGLAFEYALIDADMMLTENPSNNYLLGAVDDISTYNYYFEDKRGWYKKEEVSNKILYETNSTGSIAGEAAVMFLVNAAKENAIAKLSGVETLHDADESTMKERLVAFITKYLPAGEKIDLLISGENGNTVLSGYYAVCESCIEDDVSIARYKHMCGEFPTATAMGLWLSVEILQKNSIPEHMIKRNNGTKNYRNILMYNNYKGIQHSFMMVSLP